jgi:hypothetical protein
MKKSISKVRSGDVVCVDRGLYQHYGVYDHGKVIDISTDNGDNSLLNKHNAHVRKRSMGSFLANDPGYVDNSPGRHSRKETLKRARAEIGRGRNEYDLLSNNCEHKAREWQTGYKQSDQVNNAIENAIGTVGKAIDDFFGLF